MLCARTRGSSWVSEDGGGKLRAGRVGGIQFMRPGSDLDCSAIGERVDLFVYLYSFTPNIM
jgi:hypothetical protein